MRLSRCEVRDHMNYRKNNRRRSYRIYGALQRQKSQMCYICEIFGAPRFRGVFNTIPLRADVGGSNRQVSLGPMCGRLRVDKSFFHVLQHWSVQPCVRPVQRGSRDRWP